MKNELFCDHCGMEVDGHRAVHLPCCPIDIASVNAGESATLCRPCSRDVLVASGLMDRADALLARAAQRGPKPDELDADGMPGLGFGKGNRRA